MALTPGTRLGVYQIAALLGEGGMGPVWRATDTTLGRQVAIKILPDAFAADAERLARFEREAKTLASLNHPHIAQIYGFEKSSGMHALVMEWSRASNGSGVETRLVDSRNNLGTQDWSRDGRWLLYFENYPTTGRDLWALDMTSRDPTPRAVANTPAEEVVAAFSPDGRWVAYQTNESGRFEVVVQPFPDAGGRWQVSTTGGVAPRWRADGKELYFLAPDATMMAVPVTGAGTSLEAGTPVPLFRTRIVGGGTMTNNRPQYAVARDGRFLINQPAADAAAAPITLILNWNPEAKKER